MNNQYNITLTINNGDGKTKTLKERAEFACNPNDYGNGYHMYLETPSGGQGYDLRYESTFNHENIIAWLANFFAEMYSGSWKLIGIRIHEAEF